MRSGEFASPETSNMAAGTQPTAVRETVKVVKVRKLRVVLGVIGVVVAAILIYLVARFTTNSPVTYTSAEDKFKYGSTGGEINTGIPYSIWMALPELFPELLPDKKPGQGYRSFGFLYEDGKDLPIGISKRHYRGIDVVSFNCAICHVGSVRKATQDAPHYVVGMPSNTVDLRAFYEFLFATVQSEKFAIGPLLAEMKRQGIHEDLLNQLILRFYVVDTMRDAVLARKDRLKFILDRPEYGPGRIDTFNPPKALLNFRMDKAPEDELYGVADFPSIWNQRQRQGMHLHWDGNNDSVQERNRSAAFGTGAFPPTLDRKYMHVLEDWLLDAKPPQYPYAIDNALAARGAKVYAAWCAMCHGTSGQDFHYGQGKVGEVTPIEEIDTDRWRLDSYTYDLAVNQNLLYAGYGQERFSHFRKTYGYANMPLDGIWLRAPYLHNGSVPNMRELLKPAEERTRSRVFYRGNDVYDQANMGFDSDVPEANGKKFFKYDLNVRGNSDRGHTGPKYGTSLSAADKDALIEYLKTF